MDCSQPHPATSLTGLERAHGHATNQLKDYSFAPKSTSLGAVRRLTDCPGDTASIRGILDASTYLPYLCTYLWMHTMPAN